MPRVSVLMPAYNAERHIGAAIDSILQQKYGDFELIVVDDGSSDGTAEIVRAYVDPRLRYYRNPSNLRLAASLNRGLDLAQGDYIARMDADDIALPERLGRQVEYMDAHRDVALLGTGMTCFSDGASGQRQLIPVTDPDLLRWRQHFSNQIFHPTVMFRRAVCQELGLRYGNVPDWVQAPPGFAGVEHLSEDYLMFGLLAMRAKVTNLAQPLLRYRMHEASVSHANAARQLETAIGVSRLFFSHILGQPVSQQVVALAYFTRAQATPQALIEAACDLIERAAAAHIRQFQPSPMTARRIRRDAGMRQRILRSHNRTPLARLADCLRHLMLPQDTEEWRMTIRLLVSEQTVLWLKQQRHHMNWFGRARSGNAAEQ